MKLNEVSRQGSCVVDGYREFIFIYLLILGSREFKKDLFGAYIFSFLSLPLVNVNKIKDFGEAAKREILSDRHAFETARRLSHDNMEEKVPWVFPRPLVLPSPLVTPGSNSQERYIQAEREKGILQELFLNKER